MDARRWQAVREAFAEGLHLDPARRHDELRRRYGDDPGLVAEVEDLLGQHEAAVVEGYYVPPDDVGDEPTEPIDDDPPGRTLQPGERIGPYAIQRLLGHGGMGTVYLAERVEDYDQQVALKLIRAEVTTGRSRRFHAERQVLAQLEHPNIVRLLGGGNTTSGAPYLVMEYVDGKALDEDCDHRGLSVHDRARRVLQIVRAMAYAHDQGVLHRDLKPSNILVTAEGEPKITDFGLARPILRETDTTQTDSTTILGTPTYMAPEQIGDGPGRNLPAGDCYSLGAILYRLLAGRPPFRASTPFETCLKVIHDEPLPVRALNRAVPRDLETIVRVAMARDPAERFATPQAMAEQLRRFLTGEPLTIAPPSAWGRLARRAVRHRAGAAAWAGTVAGLLAVLIVALVVENARYRRERDRAEAGLQTMKALLKNLTPGADYLIVGEPLGPDTLHRFRAEMLAFHEQALARVPGAARDTEILYRTALVNYQMAMSFEVVGPKEHHPEIMAHLDRSITLLRDVVRAEPGNPEYRDALVRSLSARALARYDVSRDDPRAVADANGRYGPSKP